MIPNRDTSVPSYPSLFTALTFNTYLPGARFVNVRRFIPAGKASHSSLNPSSRYM